MNDSVMTELRVVVERAVRPVGASNFRKRRMREELLGHLVKIYEEEAGRLDNEQAALKHARQRFGDPGELAEELRRSVPKRDRVRCLLDTAELKPGESLLYLAIRHVLWACAAIAVTPLVVLPVMWSRGRLDEVGLALHVALVMTIVMWTFGFVFAVFSERIGRAFYGRESERSMRTTAWYCLASLFVFPTMTLLMYWGLFGDLASSLSGFYSACVVAPAAPVLFLLMARQVADEMRREEEWASLEVEE
jgi:hypothetical protein